MKRVSQLTGSRIPDHKLTSAKTVGQLFGHLREDSKPRSKTLADQLVRKQNLVKLPNVQIMSRRETLVDREKRLGRWKVIEAELQSKGLPGLRKDLPVLSKGLPAQSESRM